MSEAAPGFSLRRIARLEARLVAHEWTWARENASALAANWDRRRVGRPALYDGPVLLACGWRIAGETCAGETYAGETCAVDLFETRFSRFIGHRDLGSPDPSVANVFAAIVPWTADRAVVLGRMGAHTANAGQVYFPCGTPDLADVVDGDGVDLTGSAVREFVEETGLPLPADAPEAWLLLHGEGQLAFLRPVDFPEDAARLHRRLERHRAGEAEPELAGFVVARGPADIDAGTMPGFVRAYLAQAFEA